MKKLQFLGVITTILALAALTGCQPPPKTNAKTAKAKTDDEHDHAPGPHAGTVFDFGKWHAELVIDDKSQEATIYILGEDQKTPTPIPADKLLLSITEPKFQIDLKAMPQEKDPKEKASRFVGKHENFGKKQTFEGTLSGKVEAKHYAGDFKQEDHKPEKVK